MNLHSIDHARKIVITILVLAFITALVILAIVLPARSIRRISNETNQVRTYLEQKHEQTQRYRVTKRDLDNVMVSSTELVPHLFKKGEELKLITYLENLATRHDLSQAISNSNLDNITNNKITLSLNMTGGYRSLFEYLRELEASDYFFIIEALQLTPAYRDGKLTATANLFLTISLYVSP